MRVVLKPGLRQRRTMIALGLWARFACIFSVIPHKYFLKYVSISESALKDIFSKKDDADEDSGEE